MKRLIYLLLAAVALMAVEPVNAQFIPPKRPAQPTTPAKPKAKGKAKAKSQSATSSLAKRVNPDTLFTVNGVSFGMIRVAGGTFTMGATAEQGSDPDSDEKPTHKVTLSDYRIGQTEVTEALWAAVMGSNPSYFKKGDDYPVENVSWDDCQKFISKLNEMTGETFRLPTEAEWEYAARGGNQSKGYKYAGSKGINDVAWYYYNSGDAKHPVATKAPNELGLYDMSGNVWEWCQDWYDHNYYSSSPTVNPTGPTAGSYRVYRGGNWYAIAWCCRVSDRNGTITACSGLGLRLAR